MPRDRPLSPHLQVYRWSLSMTLSILHRFTGVGLALGLVALSWWLVAIAGGEDAYASAFKVLASPAGLVLMLAWTFAFLYHLLNGVRHLMWDVGYGFERAQRNASGWIVVLCSLGLTVGVWVAIFAGIAVVSLRSPLGRVLGMGSAKEGTGHWSAQRISAVALIPLTLWLFLSLLLLPGLDYVTVRTWLSIPISSFLAILTVAVLTYHAYLGTNVVVEDYVSTPGMRVLTSMLLRFLYVLVGGAGIFAVLRVAFGS